MASDKMSPAQRVSDAIQAVEEAWGVWDAGGHADDMRTVLHRLAAYLHARRAAKDAGFVEVMVGPSLDRPLDTAQYHSVRGERSSHGGWVWVQNKQPDGKIAVVLSQETVEALSRQQQQDTLYEREQLTEARTACNLLARDLSDVLKKGTLP